MKPPVHNVSYDPVIGPVPAPRTFLQKLTGKMLAGLMVLAIALALTWPAWLTAFPS